MTPLEQRIGKLLDADPACKGCVTTGTIEAIAALVRRPDDTTVEQVARDALFGTELARTGVVNPVNGSAAYSYVTFHGQRVTFHDGEFTIHRTAGTEKAAAYAEKINDALLELAKKAAFAALVRRPDAGELRARLEVKKPPPKRGKGVGGKGGPKPGPNG